MRTGAPIWQFQTVHHNLFDYDPPAQPTLIDVKRDGQDIPAVAQPTKVGFLWVLNRETGQPLFPVSERAVAQSDVPGECRVEVLQAICELSGRFNRLVASSMNASRVHISPRASNQACSEPSICTSSPRQSRRRRGGAHC